MYSIKELDQNVYKGFKIEFAYTTQHYYDVKKSDLGFILTLNNYDGVVKKTFVDTLFENYLEFPYAIGLFDNQMLIGLVEGNYEEWHQCYRITNIHVDEAFRNKGYGQILMKEMIEISQKKYPIRAIVLETQSCNFPAISFYKKMGFSLIGLDTISYSNNDIEKKDVRLEFGLLLNNVKESE